MLVGGREEVPELRAVGQRDGRLPQGAAAGLAVAAGKGTSSVPATGHGLLLTLTPSLCLQRWKHHARGRAIAAAPPLVLSEEEEEGERRGREGWGERR